ncbi:hypothetical protein O0I10_005996 [Lichtheimia ornata]|uniref:Uncharacterized protein n=1 Tax=Lichtheimia ornata TaxID=688661 RepID=A0AAD7XZ86_9FUNG|nr:uncharacterized protein O0I10_005996 [Lichtheimia ornata]KAJ8658313.1 hypothetical protein O0I10_005996 [Lichtheimia ornata]
MSETSKKNTHHSTSHQRNHHTTSSHHHHHHHPTPTIAIKATTSSISDRSPFIQIYNPAHDAIPVSRYVPSTSMPFITSATTTTTTTTTAASITPSVPIITDSSSGKQVNDNLVGTMLGTLGGFTVLLMAIILFTSVKRSRRRARQNNNQQGRGVGGGKRGWGIRESWYSDTLSTCPSTLPPPYDVGYDEHDKKEQPTSGAESGKNQQLLQPPSPTAACTTNKAVQYAPQLAYSPTSYSAFDMTKHDLEKQQPSQPNSAVTASNVRNSLQYAPQLAFSPSFHTSNLISGIDMSQETLPPVPFVSRSTPSNERGDVQGQQQQQPSPTTTQSTPHYLPQLAFSRPLQDTLNNQESMTPTTHHVVQQPSSSDTSITVDENQERHLLSQQRLPELPPATAAASSRRTSTVSLAATAAAAGAAATPSPIVVPRPSRSTVRSYHAQLNMDL